MTKFLVKLMAVILLSQNLFARPVIVSPAAAAMAESFGKLLDHYQNEGVNIDLFLAEATGFIRNKDVASYLDGQKQYYSLYRQLAAQLATLSESDKLSYMQGESRRFRGRKNPDLMEPLRGKFFFNSMSAAAYYGEIAFKHFTNGNADLAWYLFEDLGSNAFLLDHFRFGFLVMGAFAAKSAGYEAVIEPLLTSAAGLGSENTNLSFWADEFAKSGWDWRTVVFGNNPAVPLTLDKIRAQIKAQAVRRPNLSEPFLEMLIFESLDPALSVRKKAITLLQAIPAETLQQLSIRKFFPSLLQSSLENMTSVGLPSEVRAFGSSERIGGFSGKQLISVNENILYSRNLDTGVKTTVGKLPSSEFDPVVSVPKHNDKIVAVFSRSKISGNIYQIDGTKISVHPIMEQCGNDSLRDAQFSADGKTVAVKCAQSTTYDKILIFKLSAAKPDLVFSSPRATGFSHLSVSAKGNYVAYFAHDTVGGLTTKLYIWDAVKNKVTIEKEYPFNKLTRVLDRVVQVKSPGFADDESDFVIQWKTNLETWDLKDGTVLTKDLVDSPKRECLVIHPTKGDLKWIEFTADGARFRSSNSSPNKVALGKFSSSAPVVVQGEKLYYLNARHQLVEAYVTSGWHPEEVAEIMKNKSLGNKTDSESPTGR